MATNPRSTNTGLLGAQAPSPPSISDYLARQQSSFQPSYSWGQDVQQFDPSSALQGYAAAGGKISLEDWLSAAQPYLQGVRVENGDSGEYSVDYTTAKQKAAQQWVNTFKPEYAQQGYTIGYNGGSVNKNLGDNWWEARAINADGSLGAAQRYQGDDSSFLERLSRPALMAASIIPSPIQPFAQVANAALAAKNGKPLNAALSLVGAANSAGLLDSVGDAASVGGSSDLYSLGNAQLGDVTAPGYLGNANLGNSTGLGGTGSGLSATTDIFSGVGGSMSVGAGSALSPSVQLGTPNYDITTGPPVTSPNGEGISTGPVNGGNGNGLSATPGQGLTLADPGAANGLLGGDPPQSIIDQAKAAGKSVTDWMKENPIAARALIMAGGAVLNTMGGSGSSGGSGYKDDGYRPTISRGGWQASIPATQVPTPQRPPMGLITLPTTGQANDGLWRYGGNRSQPHLVTAPPAPPTRAPVGAMPPRTGLISPPAVASYNPRPTGPLPANLSPMQVGYDDPVPNLQNMTPAQQQLLQRSGLLNTNPTPRGWM